jgi:hypothetical protein
MSNLKWYMAYTITARRYDIHACDQICVYLSLTRNIMASSSKMVPVCVPAQDRPGKVAPNS